VLAIRSCSRPLGRGEREEEEEAAEEKEEQAEQAVDFWKGSRISSNLKAGRQASQWKGIESNQIEWKETEWKGEGGGVAKVESSSLIMSKRLRS